MVTLRGHLVVVNIYSPQRQIIRKFTATVHHTYYLPLSPRSSFSEQC